MKKTQYPTKEDPKDTVDPVLTEVLDKFNASRAYYRKGFKDKWDKCRRIYDSQRVDPSYIGNSDTVIPETFSIVQSTKANVVGGKIKLTYLPTQMDQTGDIKVLNALMDQAWVNDKTKVKCSWAVEDCLVVGNGYLWQYRGKDGLPCNLYVPTEDNFFDTGATSYENLGYGGYRYVTTIDKLRAEKKTNPDYNPDDEKSELKIGKYDNLDIVEQYATSKMKIGNDKTAKQLREEMIAGSILSDGDKNEKLVEVICYHDKEKYVKIANRIAVIENISTPFARKKRVIQSVDNKGNPVPIEIPAIDAFIPVAPFRDYTDGALWYARGEVEMVAELQELLCDTQNQKTDNLNFANNRMFTLDPSQAHKIDEIQSIPGAVLTLPAGALEVIKTDSIGADADIEMSRIENAMRRTTASGELQSLQGRPTNDHVNSIVGSENTRYAFKLENLEAEGFNILGQNMFKILQLFVTSEMAVRMVGPAGVKWGTYNPGQFLGKYDVKVALYSTAKVLAETEKQDALQFYLMASKLPFVDQQKLFKVVSQTLFDKDDSTIDQLIAPPAPPAPVNKEPNVSISLKDVYEPSARAVLLAQAMNNDPSIPGSQPQESQPMTPDSVNPQTGTGEMASMPQTGAEQKAIVDSQNMMGDNVKGMPTA